MNKKSLKKIFSLKTGQFLFIGLLSLTACEDEPARLSGEVLPDNDVIAGLNYDGHQIISQNIMRDAVKTDDADYGVFGIFNDPTFGQSKAGFAANFSIGSNVSYRTYIVTGSTKNDIDTVYFSKFNNNSEKYNDVWKVDSLVLNLQYQYNDWYGDMTCKQNLQVFEVTSDLGPNTTDYDNTYVPDHNPIFIGEKTVYPNDDVPDTLRSINYKTNNLWERPDSLLNVPQYLWDTEKIQELKDSSWIDNGYSAHTTKTKYWNIKLNDEVAQRIFNADSATLANTNSFQGLFKGIYVSPEENISGEGNLTRINLLGTSSALASHMTIYFSRDHKYFNNEDELRDTTSTYSCQFPINVENVRFNNYTHSPDSRIKMNDPSTHSLYIQGMAGAYSKFNLPDEVYSWADSLSLFDDERSAEYLQTISNIEFYLEVDTLDYPSNEGGIKRYPLPESLSIMCYDDDKDKLVTPYYKETVNGNSVTKQIFGSNVSSNSSQNGTGELVTRRVENEDGTFRYEYLYRFIMQAGYFHQIMTQLDEIRHEEGWSYEYETDEEKELLIQNLKKEYKSKFGESFIKEFYIGPNSATFNFRRVKLFGGAHPDKPMKMNIKYYHYFPR